MNDSRDESVYDPALSSLYRETRRIEPPAWLDRRILTAARTAVEPRPAPVNPLRGRGIRRWTVPAALAATVILTAGVVQLAHKTGQFSAPMAIPTAQPSGNPDEPSLNTVVRMQSMVEDRMPAPAAPASPPSPAQAPVMETKSIHDPRAPSPGDQTPIPATGFRPEPSLREETMGPAAKPAEWDEISAERKREEAFREQARALERSPAEWLAEIAELRRQGRIVEAEARLLEFRRRYPDFPANAPVEPPQ